MSRLQAARFPSEETSAATPNAGTALFIASGEERPVRSPALELQEVLEEMLAAQVAPTPKPAAALSLGLGLIGVAGVCAAFWVGVGRLVISLV